MNIYITRKIHAAAEESLTAGGAKVTVNPHDRPLTPDELRHALTAADGALCLLNDKITADLMDAAPRCRIYANYAVGFDNMDTAAATKRGIALSNTPDVLTEATAELAWALIFAAARRVCEGDRLTRAGNFDGWAPMMLLGYELGGKTLGIIGAGRIGTTMARGATGFNMRILYTKRSGRNEEMQALGATHAELEQLLRESDFISIHAPLTSETRHMIGREQFQMMKRNCVLVNTGRGPVIDEAALVEALRSERIAAAGLDVYEHEPSIAPGLAELENVVLAPHIGSATHEAREQMAILAANNILDYFAGTIPRTCINPEYAKQ